MSRSISAALKAHLASGKTTVAQCLNVTLTNGSVYGFTDHDRDISGIPGDGTTYYAASGFFAKAIQTSSALNVDTTGIGGPQISPNIVAAEMYAGKWDFARFKMFLVNYADLTQGVMSLRGGWIGEMKLGINDFEYEIRGIMQAYTKSLCELTSPGCRNALGDARCRANLVAFTYTGTITGVSADNQTLYDTGRTEPGPTGGVAITGVTNANPGVVTMADGSLNLIDGQAITISGVVGMPAINVVTVARNPTNVSPFTFQLSVDTTDTAVWGTYSTGGTVSPFSGTGGTTGFFDGGKITFTSGLNNGISQEIKSYVEGQITLILPMPFVVSAGDTYSIITGCDKTTTMCIGRYNNIANFVGEPYMRGIDQLVQVGRHTGA